MEGRPADCLPACDLAGTARGVFWPGRMREGGDGAMIVFYIIVGFPLLVILELAKKYK
jgi:hypothetical protein